MPDEEAWQALKPFPFIMYQPVHGKEPTERTDVRIGFDKDFLYVGAHLYYEDVTLMRATGKKRDYDQMTCDFFGIHLDSYFDRQNALVFYTNPHGIRFDASVKRDIKTFDQDVNMSWNTFWEVKTVVDSKGWHTEFRIPISSLRFQPSEEGVRMGLTLSRYMPAKNEMSVFPAIPIDYNFGTWKPSLTQEVWFMGLQPRRPFYVSPYLLAGWGYVHQLNAEGSEWIRKVEPKLEPGLDVKVGLTGNLTMDVTLNTDFAQVEADDEQINLTRYSLYFPEKRLFFQEKSDAFDFPMGGPNNLFYSRRIGLYDGRPVRIYGGARVTGRAGNWDVGALSMQTATLDQLPSENFGVVRLRRTVFNQNSYLGGMFTSRIGLDGRYNFASGFDGNIKVFGDDWFSFNIAHSLDSKTHRDVGGMDPWRMQFVWDRRSDLGLAYDVTFTWTGRDFNPGIGFMRKTDYLGGYLMAQYGWAPEESSWLLRHKIKTEWMHYQQTHTWALETMTLKTGWNFETRSGLYAEVAHNYALEVLHDTLVLSGDTRIFPGSYPFHFFSTEMMLPPSLPVVGQIMAEAGGFFDGYLFSTTLMPNWSIASGVDLSGTYRFDWITIPGRDISFVNHIVGIKTLFTFTTKTSLAGFVQYNTAADALIANVRFRYNPREGVDLYLVYNEGLNTDPRVRMPELPLSDSRTFMAKITYTLRNKKEAFRK